MPNTHTALHVGAPNISLSNIGRQEELANAIPRWDRVLLMMCEAASQVRSLAPFDSSARQGERWCRACLAVAERTAALTVELEGLEARDRRLGAPGERD